MRESAHKPEQHPVGNTRSNGVMGKGKEEGRGPAGAMKPHPLVTRRRTLRQPHSSHLAGTATRCVHPTGRGEGRGSRRLSTAPVAPPSTQLALSSFHSALLRCRDRERGEQGGA